MDEGFCAVLHVHVLLPTERCKEYEHSRFLAASLDLMSLEVFIVSLLWLAVCFFILDHHHATMGTFYRISVILVIWTKSKLIEMLNSVRNTETHPKGDSYSFLFFFFF